MSTRPCANCNRLMEVSESIPEEAVVVHAACPPDLPTRRFRVEVSVHEVAVEGVTDVDGLEPVARVAKYMVGDSFTAAATSLPAVLNDALEQILSYALVIDEPT